MDFCPFLHSAGKLVPVGSSEVPVWFRRTFLETWSPEMSKEIAEAK